MKLSVFDRVLLALLLIIAIVFSFVLFGMAANLIPEDMVTGSSRCSTMPGRTR